MSDIPRLYTGEAESIAKHQKFKFGDRALPSKPPTRDEVKKYIKPVESRTRSRQKKVSESVLSENILEGIVYQPKTPETSHYYEKLLLFIQEILGNQQLTIIMSCADEILSVLKDENLRPNERKSGVEETLGNLSDEKYSELIRIVQHITDYVDETGDEEQTDRNFEDQGISVIFGDDDEEENEDFIEEEEEEEEEVLMEREEGEGDSDDMDIEEAETTERPHNYIDPKQIDAHWLQRQLNTIYNDAEKTSVLSKNILEALSKKDERECQNELQELLEYDHFDFLKVLLQNRNTIYYCIRLSQAQDEEQKKSIIKEMEDDPDLRRILVELNETSSFSKGIEKEISQLTKKPLKQTTDENIKIEKTIDLDALAFDQRNYRMPSKQIVLPKHTERIQKKGYEEILIPGVKMAPPSDEEEYPISKFPEWTHKAFAGMKTLNRIQSKLRAAAFETDENILLCAPTGSGKTNVAMMCILHEISKHIDLNTQEIDLNAFKVVYIAPMKSLVQEMTFNFSERLKAYGINVRELSGDINLTKQQIEETQVIVTTPEKWDIITRKSGERTYVQLVRLLIIDEIHLLHDERGPVIESIIARSLRQFEEFHQPIRLVGLSATLPGYEDVSTFLRVKPEYLFSFENKYRPIPLEQSYIGIKVKKPFKRHQLMNEICYEKVMALSGEQVLVFVHSRKETAKTAKIIRDLALENNTIGRFMKDDPAYHELLRSQAEEAINADLKELLPYGIAIHHAGLLREDRSLVEELFADRKIPLLISTATLAWGVNLPAHAVIIKGTQVYSPEKGGWTELSYMDILQMLGRAGRPQYDIKGVGIVITSYSELQYYISLLNQQLPIESQMIKKLADNMNAEIVLGTIQNIRDGVNWLSYTYLYICMLRNPTLYGISSEELESDPILEKRRYILVHSAATLLAKHGLIRYDRKSGKFQATDFGKIASLYYIPHQSMAIYNEHLKSTTTDIELLRIFSLSTEFQQISVRADEKSEIEALLDRVPIPIKEGPTDPSAKVNALLQVYISKLKLDGFSLIADMVYITQSAGRIMRSLFEMSLKKGWFTIAEKCLNFCKMIERRMWSAQSPLRQFKTLPEEIIRRLEKKDLSMDQLYELSSQELGVAVREPTYGKQIHQLVHTIPRLDLVTTVQPITRTLLRIDLTITPDFEWNEKYLGKSQIFWVFVIDGDGDNIIHYEQFLLKKRYSSEEHYITFTATISEPIPPQYYIKVISDRWISSESTQPISFRTLIPPDRYTTTELLDLQKLPISTLSSPFASVYENMGITYFNAIQTQVFNALYQTDNNTLVCAPTGTGKTLCAEIAILRELNKEHYGKIVYICPITEQIPYVLNSWKNSFGNILGKKVNVLVGDSADTNILAESDITISTPEQWDVISRRWKKLPLIQNTTLFIIDDLHMIGNSEYGPTLEIIVSRMRYISQQLKDVLHQEDKKIRLVGLSTSIANAKEVGEWMGCSHNTVFGFAPEVRPVPLEVNITGFEMKDFNSKMLSMTRPLYYSISRSEPKSPTIIFVPSRKISRNVVNDLISFSLNQDDSNYFLNCDLDQITSESEKYVSSKLLKGSITYGIGFYNDSLDTYEKEFVLRQYNSDNISMLVVDKDSCWNLPCRAHHVIVMGTEYYEGKEHRYVDYQIVDLLQMIGYAGRQLKDKFAKCTIFCNSSRKEFYRKFINEPLPIESQLDRSLHDHFNAEIVTKVIENFQDSVDYLTWTYFYRRLQKNPNYYDLQALSPSHISDHLSELVEETLNDLKQANCITIEEQDLLTLNAGMIAAYYNLKYTTIELFNLSLVENIKMKGLLEIISNATEFEILSMRHKEDKLLEYIASHLPLKIESPNYTSPSTKVNILLQCHFSRREIPSDLEKDLNMILTKTPNLIYSMTDILATNGWLSSTIACMELSQMIVQAMWDNDSVFKQLPHFTPEVIARIKKEEPECETIFDLIDMDDQRRQNLLRMNAKQLSDVAAVCNKYPNIDVSYKVMNESVNCGNRVNVIIRLEREHEESFTSTVHAPFYPKEKYEGWWLVIGDPKENQLASIKKVNYSRESPTVKMNFVAPNNPGKYTYTLYLISDSWVGCDQEYEFEINVTGDMDEEE